jgi:hypothetical protein
VVVGDGIIEGVTLCKEKTVTVCGLPLADRDNVAVTLLEEDGGKAEEDDANEDKLGALRSEDGEFHAFFVPGVPSQ